MARRQRRSALKLAINIGLGAAGIALAPPTVGWSLLVTAGSAFMLVWDSIDTRKDYVSNRPSRQRLRELRLETS
jgi:hypothetical protein